MPTYFRTILRKSQVHVIISWKSCLRRNVLTLHKPKLADLWIWLQWLYVNVQCCGLLRLVKEPLYCNTDSGYPLTGLEKVLLVLWHRPMPQLPLSGSPAGIRKEHTGSMEWDSSPVHLTLTSTAYADFGMCHRFVRSVRSRYCSREHR